MERLPRSATRWGWRLVLATLVGVVAGAAASALEATIDFGSGHLVGTFTHLGGSGVGQFNLGVLLLPAGGALLAGIFTHMLGRSSERQGVEGLTRAFHHALGALGIRGPLVRAAGSSLVISSGGSAGPEGPVAALGASIGSAIGKLFPVMPHERRIMLVAGCAAGVGAIFRCPLGGALFATGVLYRDPEFETDAMVPAVIASVIGYATYVGILDFEGPLLAGVATLRFTTPIELLPYLLLGPLCGVIGIFFSFCYHTVEHRLVPRSPLPPWANPAVGGLATGALACLVPQVMDGRNLFIQNALSGSFFETTGTPNWWWWAMLFGLVALAKCVATALTVGSGAPGGLLGPSVFIGGAVGACLGAVCEALMPGTFPEPLREALIPVGMAGVFACTMRVPLASLVMITEMTGSYGLIAPLMLVCVSSYVIGRRWGLNTEQVRSSAESPAHTADPIIHLLETLRVAHVTQRIWPLTVDPDTPAEQVLSRIEPGSQPVVAVAREGELIGLILPTDLVRVLSEPAMAPMLLASDICTTRYSYLRPEDDLYYALGVFQQSDQDVLPVYSRTARKRWRGMVTRKKIAERLSRRIAQLHHKVMEEHESLGAIDHDMQLLQWMKPVAASGPGQVERLFVPIDVVGQSLRDADFRRRYNTQVIAIEQPDGSTQCPPDPSAPLRTDQRLWAIREG